MFCVFKILHGVKTDIVKFILDNFGQYLEILSEICVMLGKLKFEINSFSASPKIRLCCMRTINNI